MPDILPPIPPQATVAPNKAPSSQANKAAPPDRREPEPDRDTDSFADTYEAIESEEAPPRPEPKAEGETEGEGDTPAAIPFAVAEVAATPLPTDAQVEDGDLPRPKPTGLPTETLALRSAETATAEAPKPRSAQLPTQPQAQLRATDAAQAATAQAPLPETAEVPDTPQPAQNRAAPTAPEIAILSKTLPAAPQPKEVDVARLPLVEADIEIQPETEIEPELPKRLGLRDAAPQPQITGQTGLATAQQGQPQLQTTETQDTNLPLPDELLATGQQPVGTGVTISPTAPGAVTAQIVQHAAGQIVAALPRDQGVFITDAGAEIALDPPELGRVRMIVTEVAGGLALTVTAERPETLDLFKRHASMLAEEFAREGFSDADFAFEGEDDGERGNTEPQPVLRVTADPQELLNGITARVARGGGLDLRL